MIEEGDSRQARLAAIAARLDTEPAGDGAVDLLDLFEDIVLRLERLEWRVDRLERGPVIN